MSGKLYLEECYNLYVDETFLPLTFDDFCDKMLSDEESRDYYDTLLKKYRNKRCNCECVPKYVPKFNGTKIKNHPTKGKCVKTSY